MSGQGTPGGVVARVPLGRRGVTVSRIGFGTAPIGGLFSSVGDDAAEATLAAAWAGGVRYFDTAPHYGLGSAERRLGAFLAGLDPAARAEAVVSTKVGRLLEPGRTAPGTESFHDGAPLVRRRDYTSEGVYRSLADSLERSGLDAFDIALIHDPDEHWAEAAGVAYPALARLRDEGAVRAIGVGMNQTAMLARFVTETDIDCVMVAGRYSLLDRSAADELLPLCAERGVGVLAAGVFNSGVLADPRPGAHYDYAPAPEAVLRRARWMADRCAAHEVPLAAAALRFPLRHPAVTGIVVGARTPAEITTDLTLAATQIPDALWDELTPA
ncbi:aldo/keto reductase [Actinomadura sp. HBU206391]|uniref:aldo/keto reductase n=1 Tax=Actinomadura sp. HBU206391 TaxID=2731692 RepID=UPI00164FF68B|nr:aldo/keto reductase [Actinomadura sp. HBU206391]MBC6461813.1 aldo/keto reductase [Actinomadura sp. HBU206391]